MREHEHLGVVEVEEPDPETVVLLSGGKALCAEHFDSVVQIVEQNDAVEDGSLERMAYEHECILQAGAESAWK